jgi:UDP-N-acetylmuramate: L-alanyl-gamma-D-glutamyl-meso-diaminopimelate ligase
MEQIAQVGETTIYDDFAHHPTAIRRTLQGLRNKVGNNEEIIAIVEPRTHTMSLGTLRDELTTCCAAADAVYWYRGENIRWDLSEVVQGCVVPAFQHDDLDRLIDALCALPERRRHLVIMSNGSFGGIYTKLPRRLRERPAAEPAQT